MKKKTGDLPTLEVKDVLSDDDVNDSIVYDDRRYCIDGNKNFNVCHREPLTEFIRNIVGFQASPVDHEVKASSPLPFGYSSRPSSPSSPTCRPIPSSPLSAWDLEDNVKSLNLASESKGRQSPNQGKPEKVDDLLELPPAVAPRPCNVVPLPAMALSSRRPLMVLPGSVGSLRPTKLPPIQPRSTYGTSLHFRRLRARRKCWRSNGVFPSTSLPTDTSRTFQFTPVTDLSGNMAGPKLGEAAHDLAAIPVLPETEQQKTEGRGFKSWMNRHLCCGGEIKD